ncbi:MAG: hypothetical protein ACM3VU_00270 [Arthrospira platensis]
MSDATLNDPPTRATQNSWYLYFGKEPMHGPNGHVRAVIEVVSDETYSEGGPVHARRRAFIAGDEVRDVPQEHWIGLPLYVEEMSDESFQKLIDDRTLIPIVQGGSTR